MPNIGSWFRVHSSWLRGKFFLLLLLPLLLTTYYLLPIIPAYAQTPTPTTDVSQAFSADISSVYDVTDTEAIDGDILVSTTDKGLIRATAPYDSHLFGVLQSLPLMVFRRIDNQGKPVARNGTTRVNITTLNGPIKAGDYITSSEIPGKGQKADASGYVIGVALSPFGENDGQKINYQNKQVASGTINVALKIEYAELTTPRPSAVGNRMLGAFEAAFFKNVQDPSKFSQVLRYILAAIVVLVSLGVGFLTFSRSIPKGVEAIGRNPLAEKAILFGIILNIIFTVLIAGVGVTVAVFILRL